MARPTTVVPLSDERTLSPSTTCLPIEPKFWANWISAAGYSKVKGASLFAVVYESPGKLVGYSYNLPS